MALLEDLADEFIRSMTWSDKATEDQKQLVNGNVRAFTQFLSSRLGNAAYQITPIPPLPPSVQDKLIKSDPSNPVQVTQPPRPITEGEVPPNTAKSTQVTLQGGWGKEVPEDQNWTQQGAATLNQGEGKTYVTMVNLDGSGKVEQVPSDKIADMEAQGYAVLKDEPPVVINGEYVTDQHEIDATVEAALNQGYEPPSQTAIDNADKSKRRKGKLMSPQESASGDVEHTSPSIASIAARGLKHPEELTPEEIKSVCASALTQASGNEDQA